MTENETRRTDTRRRDGEPMANVSHTDSGAASSLRQLYVRGRTVAADGGRAGARDRDDASEDSADEEMRTVDHATSDDSEPNRVFERGGEFEDE